MQLLSVVAIVCGIIVTVTESLPLNALPEHSDIVPGPEASSEDPTIVHHVVARSVFELPIENTSHSNELTGVLTESKNAEQEQPSDGDDLDKSSSFYLGYYGGYPGGWRGGFGGWGAGWGPYAGGWGPYRVGWSPYGGGWGGFW